MLVPKVVAQQVELDLTLDQVLAFVRQLRPEEREIIRRAIEPPVWNQRFKLVISEKLMAELFGVPKFLAVLASIK